MVRHGGCLGLGLAAMGTQQNGMLKQEYWRAWLDVTLCFFLQCFVRYVRWSVTLIDFISN